MVLVRKVEKSDLPRYKELTDHENWNHCLAEYELVLSQVPDGAFCVQLDDGTLASFCGGYALDENNVLVYSYVTDKKYRGLGYGSMAFKAVTEWAKGKNMYLNAADGKESLRSSKIALFDVTILIISSQKEEMYGRSGFKSFMWVDYQLVAKVKPTEEVTKLAETVNYRNIQKLTSAEVVNDFDNSISPFKRSETLQYFLDTSVVSFVSMDSSGKVDGYVSCKRLDTCHSLQPFYAATPEVAEKLLVKVLMEVEIDHLQWMVPKENEGAWYLLGKYFTPDVRKAKNTNLGRDGVVAPPIAMIYSMLDYMCAIC